MMFLNLVSTSVCPGKYVCCKNSKGQSKASEDRYFKKIYFVLFLLFKKNEGIKSHLFYNTDRRKNRKLNKNKKSVSFLASCGLLPHYRNLWP